MQPPQQWDNTDISSCVCNYQRVKEQSEGDWSGSRLTDHRIQSHNASDEVVKVQVAVFVAVAADDELVELIVQWETCKHTAEGESSAGPAEGHLELDLHLRPWRHRAPPWSRSHQSDQRRSRCRLSVGVITLASFCHLSSHGFMMLTERGNAQAHLPLLDVSPHVFELTEAQFPSAVTLNGLELKALAYERRLDIRQNRHSAVSLYAKKIFENTKS